MAQYKGAASEAGRALHLIKKREKQHEEIQFRKKKIEEDLKLNSIENKFAAHYDAVEQELKSSTIGLVTLDQMKARQERVIEDRERQLAQKEMEKEQARLKEIQDKLKAKERQMRKIQTLSFNIDDDEEHEENDDFKNDDDDLEEDEEEPPPLKKKKIGKNPDVDTSFLPDKDREEEEKRMREELRQEWVQKQENIKSEEILVVYSYWDGSGHRKQTTVKKGSSIYQFLQQCLAQLRKEFSELRPVTADQLMYVKEDLIIPHHYTFYDFIVTNARGKSGPLFSFNVSEDVRLVSDATVEKEESHAGKVLLRSWYERNKHIFPASRWEPYDPTKKYDTYTVRDKKTNK